MPCGVRHLECGPEQLCVSTAFKAETSKIVKRSLGNLWRYTVKDVISLGCDDDLDVCALDENLYSLRSVSRIVDECEDWLALSVDISREKRGFSGVISSMYRHCPKPVTRVANCRSVVLFSCYCAANEYYMLLAGNSILAAVKYAVSCIFLNTRHTVQVGSALSKTPTDGSDRYRRFAGAQ